MPTSQLIQLMKEKAEAVQAVVVEIKKTYHKVLDQDGRTPVKNLLLSNVMKNRRLFHFILRNAYLAQKPLARKEPMLNFWSPTARDVFCSFAAGWINGGER